MSNPTVDVNSLGNLARLDFSEQDRNHFSEQLPRILEYVGQLQAVEVERSVMTPAGVVQMRSDQTDPANLADQILVAAPERQAGWWKVSSVF